MKVLHIVYECEPGRHKGGVSKAVHELAIAQSKTGESVEVWSISNFQNESSNFGYLHRRFKGEKFFGSISSRDIVNFLESIQGQVVVHLHNTFHALNIQVGSKARELGFKTFYTPHGALDPVLLKSFSLKSLKKRLYCHFFEIPSLNKANGVIALTEFENIGLQSIGVKSPIFVVPNGIHLPLPQLQQEFSRKDYINLLYLGRINPKKRIEHIIKALSLVSHRGFNVRLLIAGDEKQNPFYTKKLNALVDELDLGARISWLGFRDDLQKRELFKISDLFLHASESEGMAMAILEAMSYSVPVVASKGCYMSSAAHLGAIIEYESGENQLADTISNFLSSDGEFRKLQGDNGYKYVSSFHAWESIAEKLHAIYKK